MRRDSPALTTIILFLALFHYSSPTSACNARDKAALLAFKSSFISTNLNTWLESTDCCSWEHVGCNGAPGRVTSLDLWNDDDAPEIFLNGSIPASIGYLSALESISFNNHNALFGPIPRQLSKLNKLKSLWIMNTAVSGPVPSFLSELRSLETLVLKHNLLSGRIPSSLGSLPNLGFVYMPYNRLSGPIPGSLFSSLPKGGPAALDLAGNGLTGKIPRSFRNVDFQIISLEDNKLTGDASVLFDESKRNTQTVVLAGNRLEFDFGKVEFAASIGYLNVSHNRIYGSIPSGITEHKWYVLDLSYNRLCGKIPTGGNFTIDKEYVAHNKCLCGAPLKPCK